MNISTPRLVLHPADHHYVPDNISAILEKLRSIHFISDAINDSHSYLAGDDFINLLSFLGCSPNIILSPDKGDTFCSIAIPDAHDDITLLGYTAMIVPRCQKCDHKISDWKQHFHQWKKGDYIYTCPECHHEMPVTDLKWRQEAGYGRFSILINQIHPHEAVPSEKLLNALQQVTNTDWTYFYATH